MAKPDIRLKRAYDEASKQDGKRVLVDRIWPRGVAKEKLALETWLKDIAPSSDLRKWFAHDRDKWSEFKQSYLKELESVEKKDALNELRELCDGQRVTLVFSAKDEQCNNAVVLQERLQNG